MICFIVDSQQVRKKIFSKGQVDKIQGEITQQPRTARRVQKEGEREVRFGDVTAGVISKKHPTVLGNVHESTHTHTQPFSHYYNRDLVLD